MLRNLKKLIQSIDEHTLEVIKKSSSSLVVKLIGMVVGFFVSIFLGRTLGADGLGVINLSLKIVAIVMIFCLLGMPQVIIKRIAIAFNKNNWKDVGDVMFTAYVINGAITIFISLILIFLAPILAEQFFKEPKLTYPLIIAAIAMVPQVFSRLFSSALVGYRKIWQSNLVDQTLSIVIIAVALAAAYFLNHEITINLTATFYAIARLGVMLSMVVYWKTLFKSKLKRHYKPKPLLKTAIPLLFVSAALIISSSIDSIMIGWLSSAKQVGLFSVALKLALLTSFFMQITVSTLSPKIAYLYRESKIGELKQMVQSVTRILTLIGLCFLLIMLLFGKHLLQIWGVEFVGAYSILIVLTVGQFFNIASGPVGNLLMMTGFEKILRNITFLTLALNLILNYILISKFDALGAAIATALTVALNMTITSYYVYKKIGFVPFTLKF